MRILLGYTSPHTPIYLDDDLPLSERPLLVSGRQCFVRELDRQDIDTDTDSILT